MSSCAIVGRWVLPGFGPLAARRGRPRGRGGASGGAVGDAAIDREGRRVGVELHGEEEDGLVDDELARGFERGDGRGGDDVVEAPGLAEDLGVELLADLLGEACVERVGSRRFFLSRTRGDAQAWFT